MWFKLPKTVIALGVVSFFTDFSSEMIYPLLPVFLSSTLGAGALALGLIEGVAESISAILKIVSGFWSDRVKRKKPLILTGYGLAGLVRPLIGLAKVWPVVLILRFLDRVGKGLRTSPRDVLIAEVTQSEHRGMAFGFHRAMDHAGAVVGPLTAAMLLSFAGLDIRTVFLLAVIPAIVVVFVIIFAVKESPRRETTPIQTSYLKGAWRKLGGNFRLFLIAIFIFTLGNSTDAFLLLRLNQAGVHPAWIAILWSAFHIVKMLSSYFGGALSDKIGRKPSIIMGWVIYALVYIAFALLENSSGLITVFLIYGLYFGLTESSEKAWVSELAPAEIRGAGFGFYNGIIGLGALPASVFFGFFWKLWGAPVAFFLGAVLSLVAILILIFVKNSETNARNV
jgi:MFS family permease